MLLYSDGHAEIKNSARAHKSVRFLPDAGVHSTLDNLLERAEQILPVSIVNTRAAARALCAQSSLDSHGVSAEPEGRAPQ